MAAMSGRGWDADKLVDSAEQRPSSPSPQPQLDIAVDASVEPQSAPPSQDSVARATDTAALPAVEPPSEATPGPAAPAQSAATDKKLRSLEWNLKTVRMPTNTTLTHAGPTPRRPCSRRRSDAARGASSYRFDRFARSPAGQSVAVKRPVRFYSSVQHSLVTASCTVPVQRGRPSPRRRRSSP